MGVGAAFDASGFNTEDCLGRRCELTLGQGKDNQGKTVNSIDKIVPLA